MRESSTMNLSQPLLRISGPHPYRASREKLPSLHPHFAFGPTEQLAMSGQRGDHEEIMIGSWRYRTYWSRRINVLQSKVGFFVNSHAHVTTSCSLKTPQRIETKDCCGWYSQMFFACNHCKDATHLLLRLCGGVFEAHSLLSHLFLGKSVFVLGKAATCDLLAGFAERNGHKSGNALFVSVFLSRLHPFVSTIRFKMRWTVSDLRLASPSISLWGHREKMWKIRHSALNSLHSQGRRLL